MTRVSPDAISKRWLIEAVLIQRALEAGVLHCAENMPSAPITAVLRAWQRQRLAKGKENTPSVPIMAVFRCWQRQRLAIGNG